MMTIACGITISLDSFVLLIWEGFIRKFCTPIKQHMRFITNPTNTCKCGANGSDSYGSWVWMSYFTKDIFLIWHYHSVFVHLACNLVLHNLWIKDTWGSCRKFHTAVKLTQSIVYAFVGTVCMYTYNVQGFLGFSPSLSPHPIYIY